MVFTLIKKKLSLCPYSMLGGRSLCFTALYCLTRRGKKKLSTQFPLANPTMPYFPHRYLQAHCFGFGHVTVTAMRAGKTSSMTAAVFLS